MFRVSCSLRLAIALFGVLGAEAALQSAVQPCSRTNRPAISMPSKDLEPPRKSSRFGFSRRTLHLGSYSALCSHGRFCILRMPSLSRLPRCWLLQGHFLWQGFRRCFTLAAYIGSLLLATCYLNSSLN